MVVKAYVESQRTVLAGKMLSLIVAAVSCACSPFSEFCEHDDDCGDRETCDLGSCTPIPMTLSSPRFCEDKSDYTRCEVVTEPDRSYDICVDGICVSPGCGDSSCNAPGPIFLLPDTTQNDCYDDETVLEGCPQPAEPFYGQDAQYPGDVGEVGGPRFVRDLSHPDEPVVTDRVTQLVWQGCPLGLSGTNCESREDTYMFDWAAALAACDQSTWGGFDDWRLPNDAELLSIVDRSRYGPAIDPDAFPGTLIPYSWSSSTMLSSPKWAFMVLFPDGDINHDEKKHAISARCVRSDARPSVKGTVDAPFRRFVKSVPSEGEPIVEDRITSLVWQGCSARQSGDDCDMSTARNRSWKDALAYCETLIWGTFDDWRLPNINELRSIVNTRRSPAIDADVFPNTKQEAYWSSTSSRRSSSAAWITEFSMGFIHPWDKSESYSVRCVRGGLSSSTQ